MGVVGKRGRMGIEFDPLASLGKLGYWRLEIGDMCLNIRCGVSW